MSRKPFFVQHQIQSAKFWLLQIHNGFHMDLSIQSVDEWFDGFLQVIYLFLLFKIKKINIFIFLILY